MAGLLGRAIGGAMAGFGQGLVQQAKLEYETALRELERSDRRAERALDRQDRQDQWKQETEVRDRWRKEDVEVRDKDREDQQSFQMSMERERRATDAARRSEDVAYRRARDAKEDEYRAEERQTRKASGDRDERAKAREAAIERHTTETVDQESGKTVKRVDFKRAAADLANLGYADEAERLDPNWRRWIAGKGTGQSPYVISSRNPAAQEQLDWIAKNKPGALVNVDGRMMRPGAKR